MPSDRGAINVTRSRPTHAMNEFARFLRTETVGGMVLLAATAVALVWANSPLSDLYTTIRDFHVGPAALHLDLSLAEWAKNGLLAIFFFVAGLELKRELVVGELSNFRSALLPVAGAAGGMVIPAALALAVSWGAPGATTAWAIPVATDIAFALGVLAITGSGMPSSARIFLLSLAVVDDLGAILIIAIVFPAGFSPIPFVAAIALCVLYAYLQKRRITTPFLYVPLALGTWVAVELSGVHATIAGVALGLLTRVRRDPYEKEAPAVRLEHRLQPWSAGFAVPVFAFFAAGVPVNGEALREIAVDRVAIAVMVGLVLGKLIGIFGTSLVAVKLKLASKPDDMAWRDMAAVAMLGGVGFTVSLLIAELSLADAAAERAKAAVLLASALASLLAAAMLIRRSRVHRVNNNEG
ncbi:Na(+)/H(+) antiporter NhaA [Longimycelium tulufanense]|uniref:Na(+)/H(+) antiporter NhaA n=1 Tax=Longimycelium tulufanense TaxID=907463 RepID=A0A8J3FWD9_9PSEU|nr:Na+/H+ antiporter NhaA [Longimycelium tulufanense]GGM65545.1 Na(+)/H(+) antiporter NhaA [Longimycelium tulufanense]